MAWYNTDWSNRRKITINGAYITGSHSNFPVLITPSGLTGVQADGKDIVFTSDDETTRIHHEIDTFSQGTGNIWVRVPSITQGTDTDIYIYYNEGNDHRNDAGYKPSGVWDTGYVFVSHMNDITNSSVKDSTTYANTGNKSAANQPLQVSDTVLGSSQFYKITQNAELSSQHQVQYDMEEEVTLEAICNWETMTDSYGYVLNRSRGGSLSCYAFYIGGSSSTDKIRIYFNTQVSTGGSTLGPTYSQNTNHYIALTYLSGAGDAPNRPHVKCYVDGTTDFDRQDVWGGNILVYNTRDLHIGNRGGGSRRFSGNILEVRLSNIARNGGWCKTCYSSATFPSLFTTLASEENAPATATTYTTFQTLVGSSTGYIWNSGQFNTASGMMSPIGSGTQWRWYVISSSATHWYPSGSPTAWKWSKGNVGV